MSILNKLFSRRTASPEQTLPSSVIADQHKHACPYGPNFPEGRVDAGLDQSRPHTGPLFAVCNGTVTKIDPVGTHSWGGGGALYYEIDTPIAIKGAPSRAYKTCYVAEMGYINPRLKVGSRVKAGTKLGETRSGWSECGFSAGQDMSGQSPTQAGYDWRAFYHWTLSHPYKPPVPKRTRTKQQPKPSGTQVPHK